MKKHLSVFMLMARGSMVPVLGVLILMAAAQTGLFWYKLSHWTDEAQFGIEVLIVQSWTELIFGIAVLLCVFLMLRTLSSQRSRTDYTLRRLSISPRWVFFWQAVYCLAVFLLIWLVQIAVAFLLCRLYVMAPGTQASGQAVFLAFYRSPFLHALLPFDDGLVWARNGLLVLSLAVSLARYPKKDAESGMAGVDFWWVLIVIFNFSAELNQGVIHTILMICFLCSIAVTMYQLFCKEAEEAENQTAAAIYAQLNREEEKK